MTDPMGIALLLEPEEEPTTTPLWQDYDAFLKTYTAKRHPTEQTLISLRAIIPRFLKFVEARQVEDVNQITQDHVIAYLNRLVMRTSSKRLHLRQITVFMNWLYRELKLLTEKFPTVTYKGEADIPRAPQKELTREEVHAILSNIDQLDDRESVLLQLMLARPLRIGELSRLVLSDVDIARHTITITKSKNKGTRTITIPDVIYEPFRRLVYGLKPKDRVFGMGNISLIHIVNRAMEGAGIERRGRSTHSLRHTAITRLLHEAHVDVAVVAEMAGNTPQTIYRNYNHVPVQAQRDAEKELDKLLSI